MEQTLLSGDYIQKALALTAVIAVRHIRKPCAFQLVQPCAKHSRPFPNLFIPLHAL